MGKRKSGGARAVEKKHKERAAARRRGGWREKWLADLAAIGPAPSDPDKAFGWLGKAAVLIVQATMHDTALPPEQMRRDAMKQLEQATKVLEPAKLSATIDELERALEELRSHAGNFETGTDRSTPSGASLS